MSVDSPAVTVARLARLLEKQAAELTIPQYRAAMLAGGDQRAGHRAAKLTVARPTLTALVDALVDKGLVARDAAASAPRDASAGPETDAVATTSRADRAETSGPPMR